MKTILFITATRADFGKLKPLISAVKDSREYEYRIFCTGIHTMAKYGSTIIEIGRSGFDNIFPYMNQVDGDDMEVILANTIKGLSRYLRENHVDMIVVHGDRIEALASAIVGSLRNILVAHVEGGEVSGTVDELIRHAVSKLSHIHFVSTDVAQNRLHQLGEDPGSIFLIGSPDVDIMLSSNLPSIQTVKQRYEIDFMNYSIAILHPVTTDSEDIQETSANIFVDTLLESDINYVVVYPNNDSGAEYIFSAYRKLSNNPRFKIFPSLRFEYFLSLLKNADFLIGNSSAGIHEAPVYGVPTINIGTRQHNRFNYESIFNTPFDKPTILQTIFVISQKKSFTPTLHYGDGNSANRFMQHLEKAWHIPKQKLFLDMVCQ
jgi:UDP-N-acetylglucosamine 2-epimerase (hydrolysing)